MARRSATVRRTPAFVVCAATQKRHSLALCTGSHIAQLYVADCHAHGWRISYGRCGRCHTNFAIDGSAAHQHFIRLSLLAASSRQIMAYFNILTAFCALSRPSMVLFCLCRLALVHFAGVAAWRTLSGANRALSCPVLPCHVMTVYPA